MSTFLLFGATGGTGRHFVLLALQEGHTVRVLVRNPGKLALQDTRLKVQQGSITEAPPLDELMDGVEFVVSMLGDREAQQSTKINAAFVRELVPAMRRHGVKRFLYQAGGLSTPYKGHLSPLLWTIRHTVARGFEGQHRDNEAVTAYLAEEAQDIEWMVHRADIGETARRKARWSARPPGSASVRTGTARPKPTASPLQKSVVSMTRIGPVSPPSMWLVFGPTKRAIGTMLQAAPAFANHGVCFSCSALARVIVALLVEAQAPELKHLRVFADDQPRRDGKRWKSQHREQAEADEENRYADEDDSHPCCEVQTELGSGPVQRLIDR